MAVAPDCRARSGRTGRDGRRRRRISAAAGRRRRTATARPYGPSAPETRRRPNSEIPCKTFWRRRRGGPQGTLSRWKSYTNGRHLPNVTAVTERAPFFPFNGLGKLPAEDKIHL